MTMDITWIGPYKPIPDQSGGDLRSYHLMKELSRRGAKIRGYFLGSHGSECDQFLTRSQVIEHNKLIASLKGMSSRLTGTPFTVGRYKNAELMREIEQSRFVYVDHLQMVGNLSGQFEGRYWLDEHNLEYGIWGELTDEFGILKGTLTQIETETLKNYEIRSIRESAGTSIPSLTSAEELNPSIVEKLHAIPNGVTDEWLDDGEQRLNNTIEKINALGYIGEYDWLPNRQGIQRFLESVWQEFHENFSDIDLLLAGKNPPESWGDYNGVRLLGYVNSTKKFFQSIDGLVVPLSVGGGTRLKILEAAARGTPVLSTKKGMEGLNFDSDPMAESIEQLQKYLRRFTDDPTLADESRRTNHAKAKRFYRWKDIGQNLYNSLKKSY